MSKRFRTLLIWVVLFAVVVLLWQARGKKELPWRDVEAVEADLAAHRIARIRYGEGRIVVETDAGGYAVPYPLPELLEERLAEEGVQFDVERRSEISSTLVTTWVPILVILVLFLYFLRRQAGSTTNILSLRKSPARLLAETSRVRFSDVGGCWEAKDRLGDVVSFLRDPAPWTAAGARIPRGVLLEGPPGCGKSLLARAVAGETGGRFYLISASEFVEMFVGVGAARVRDLFDTATKNAPSIIFVDELDAVGRRRGSGIGSSHDEREQTLNQLLVCLDGLAQHRVVVLAATNRPDVLDAALVRPGRFDRRVDVPSPDAPARVEILGIHTRGKPLAADVDLAAVAAETDGWSGADLEALANEAAILAVRRQAATNGALSVEPADFTAALAARRRREHRFDRLDTVLFDSASQLTEPGGRAHVELRLDDGTTVVGDVLWADATFLKVASDDGEARIVAKQRVTGLRSLAGTEAVERDEVKRDLWAGRRHGAV